MSGRYNRCIIFTGGDPELRLPDGVTADGALIIAADSGFTNCTALGLEPALVVGDFDSLGYAPESAETEIFPKEKDDTDLMLAVRAALGRGCDDITILGALGGRFDHMFANVQTLAFIAERGAVGRIVSEREEITLLTAGEYDFPQREGRSLSLFAWSPRVEGLTLRGVKYALENGSITNAFPIGISNEIVGERAFVGFTAGLLLVVRSSL